MNKRYIVTKNGEPYRAYSEFAIALLVMELCQDLKSSCSWDIRIEGEA